MSYLIAHLNATMIHLNIPRAPATISTTPDDGKIVDLTQPTCSKSTDVIKFTNG